MSELRRFVLFATAPDVVGDAEATWNLAEPMLPQIREIGVRAALVAQDGLKDPPWGEFDCLFIGGSTAWKLSEEAYGLAREAARRGKWTAHGAGKFVPAVQGCKSERVRFGGRDVSEVRPGRADTEAPAVDYREPSGVGYDMSEVRAVRGDTKSLRERGERLAQALESRGCEWAVECSRRLADATLAQRDDFECASCAALRAWREPDA